MSTNNPTKGQGDHHRESWRGGGDVGLARPSPPTPNTRVTLRAMRERAGVPLGDRAARVGVSVSTLRKFEVGVPGMAPSTYAHMVAALEALQARSPR